MIGVSEITNSVLDHDVSFLPERAQTVGPSGKVAHHLSGSETSHPVGPATTHEVLELALRGGQSVKKRALPTPNQCEEGDLNPHGFYPTRPST